jgi:hypothetical protein
VLPFIYQESSSAIGLFILDKHPVNAAMPQESQSPLDLVPLG